MFSLCWVSSHLCISFNGTLFVFFDNRCACQHILRDLGGKVASKHIFSPTTGSSSLPLTCSPAGQHCGCPISCVPKPACSVPPPPAAGLHQPAPELCSAGPWGLQRCSHPPHPGPLPIFRTRTSCCSVLASFCSVLICACSFSTCSLASSLCCTERRTRNPLKHPCHRKNAAPTSGTAVLPRLQHLSTQACRTQSCACCSWRPARGSHLVPEGEVLCGDLYQLCVCVCHVHLQLLHLPLTTGQQALHFLHVLRLLGALAHHLLERLRVAGQVLSIPCLTHHQEIVQ